MQCSVGEGSRASLDDPAHAGETPTFCPDVALFSARHSTSER
jgi:hypothetical protein